MIAVAVLWALLVSAVYSLVAGWAFMLAVGVIHHEWIASCPTIGYGWAVVVALLIRWALQAISTSGSDS